MLKPDLILMDIMLDGEKDGIETALLIAEQQHVPIIYLTAHEDQELFDRAKITEPFGYLIKPFNDRDLRIVLDTSLYRHEQDKRVQKALVDVRNVLDSALDMMITFDLDGQIIEFNSAAEMVLGLKKHIAKKLSIEMLLHNEADKAIILGGDPEATIKNKKISFVDADEQIFEREIILTPVKAIEGGVQGRLLVARTE